MGWFEGAHEQLIGDELADIIGDALNTALVECQMKYPGVTPEQFIVNVGFAAGGLSDTLGLLPVALNTVEVPMSALEGDPFDIMADDEEMCASCGVAQGLNTKVPHVKSDTEPEDYERFLREVEGVDDDTMLPLPEPLVIDGVAQDFQV